MSDYHAGPAPQQDPTPRGEAWSCQTIDAITRHRLGMLGLDPATLQGLTAAQRCEVLYRGFLRRVPFETLSNVRACRASPEDPAAWPRATDRFLRENRAWGFGGTSFTLAYALRDLLHGLGVNAHCVLGRNLVTEETHAAVLAYVDEACLLYDPALLAAGPLPVRPGGTLADPLGLLRFEPQHGVTLTVTLHQVGDADVRPLYSIVPMPVAPYRFRQAWVASFCRGRANPLRIARRLGDEIRRYAEAPPRLEILTPTGRKEYRANGATCAELHDLFGIDEDVLREYFERR